MIEFDRAATGRVIRRLRQERRWSQELLSAFAGMARSHVAMIESGRKQANFETLWRIANALDLPPHTLVLMIEQEIEQTSRSQKQPPVYSAVGSGHRFP